MNKVFLKLLGVIFIVSMCLSIAPVMAACNDQIIPNCDFINSGTDASLTHWQPSGLRYNDQNYNPTPSAWCQQVNQGGNGVWHDASVKQTINIPADAKTLEWNVCTNCWDPGSTYQSSNLPEIKLGGSQIYAQKLSSGTITISVDISSHAGKTEDLELILHGGGTYMGVTSNWVNIQSTDTDNDGKSDSTDNCPAVDNPGQEDTDGDKFGDVCDNCPSDANPNQQDTDKDGIGDACEPTTAPEFPSAFLPATMIIGFLGAVLLIQRTKEH
jgi:hypothetical protein